MLMLDTWEQTAIFNPADPTQKKIEKFAGIPGQYATYYFNRVANPGQLQGYPTVPSPYHSSYALRGGRPFARSLRGLGTLPNPFSFKGLLTYAAIGLVGWLAATKTAPGKKVVRKVKGLLPHRRR